MNPKDKLREEFEAWLTKHPHLKGGNNFQIITEQYGIALSEPEYCSSWMQGTFEAFLDLKGIPNDRY